MGKPIGQGRAAAWLMYSYLYMQCNRYDTDSHSIDKAVKKTIYVTIFRVKFNVWSIERFYKNFRYLIHYRNNIDDKIVMLTITLFLN